MAEPFPLEPSLWAATSPPAVETPPLNAAAEADVCIVGGGYAGLSTALHLAERGCSAIILEEHEPGWGGSGRNGGQVIPGIKYDPSELVKKFGAEAGEAMAHFVGGTADLVFELIQKHGMDVPRTRKGWIQGAHTIDMIETVKRRTSDWQARGIAAQFLDQSQMQDHLGTKQYLGGWLDPRGGAVQPLAYARGLARTALKAGARIHGHSRVQSIRKNGAFFNITTEQGAVIKAGKVVIATGGYTGDLVPKLRQTIIAPNSFIVATEPLGDNLAATILPGGQVSSDTRQLLLYFRRDHENRFLMGGRGPFREPQSADDWQHLERVTLKMFPQLRGTAFAFRWCGRVALTRDFFPHFHEPEPGLLINIGCMGRGIGLQTAVGKAMASYLTTGARNMLPFPVVPIEPLPFHALHKLYVSAIITWYRMTDGGVSNALKN